LKKALVVLGVSALAVTVPVASAAKKPESPRAKTMKATLAPVGTAPDVQALKGKAQLVDGKRNDKVSIHVRGLAAGGSYAWHVHALETTDTSANPCAAGAPQGDIVTAFATYDNLVPDSDGNDSDTARSKAFKAAKTGVVYYVNVHAHTGTETPGAPIACGILKTKKKG
jgi:hypothetical protein